MTSERPPRRFPVALGRVASGSAKEAPRGTVAARASANALIRPQRHVAAAHADAARSRPAVGLGLDSADVRARMVERLRREGAGDARVLAAFAEVPRHLFVDAGLATRPSATGKRRVVRSLVMARRRRASAASRAMSRGR